MIVTGLLIFLAAAIVGVALISQNTSDITIHAFKWSWTIHPYWLVVAGLVIAVVAILGVVMMVIGAGHRRRFWRAAASAHRANAPGGGRLRVVPPQYAPPTASPPGPRLESTSSPGAESQSQSR